MTDNVISYKAPRDYAEPEGPAWTGAPGQIANWRAFALAGALAFGALFLPWPFAAVAAVPLLYAAWSYLVIRCISYEVSNQRLRIASGVFTRFVEEIELYRVEDTGAVAPLIYRLVGRGNAFVVTSDRTANVALLEAIPAHENVRRQLRELVEAARTVKGVHIIE